MIDHHAVTVAAPLSVLPSQEEMQVYLKDRYRGSAQHGWRVRLRRRFGYIPAEFWYEAVVDRLVTPETDWIDIGGGKAVFPHDERLSATLASRCRTLVGIDPSENIEKNPFVHERARCTIEAYTADRRFDLATLRMVAEHVQDPQSAIASLARIMRPGGHVVVYTPNSRSVASIGARLMPQAWHPRIAGLLWRAKEEDVFPTMYLMNSHRRMKAWFEDGGFREVAFAHLDDCAALQRSRAGYALELASWRLMHSLGVRFPENNLLAVYQRPASTA